MKAWHFANYDDFLKYGDGRKIILGETLSVEGTPKLCSHGLHGNVSILDAMKYAGGPNLWLVEITGNVQIGDDKICGNSRKALVQYGNILPLIVEFSFWCSSRAAESTKSAAKYAEYAESAAKYERQAQEDWWTEKLSQLK